MPLKISIILFAIVSSFSACGSAVPEPVPTASPRPAPTIAPTIPSTNCEVNIERVRFSDYVDTDCDGKADYYCAVYDNPGVFLVEATLGSTTINRGSK